MKKIYIELKNVDCNLKMMSDETVKVYSEDKQVEIEKNIQGEELIIKVQKESRKEEKNFLGVNYKSQQNVIVNIDISNSLYEMISIKGENSATLIQDIQVEHLKITNSKGRIILKNINGKEAHLETKDGRIELHHINFTKIQAYTFDGRIVIEQCIGEVLAKTENGRIEYSTEKIMKPIKLFTNKGRIVFFTADYLENVKLLTQSTSKHSNLFGDKLPQQLNNGNINVELITNNGRIEVLNNVQQKL